MFTVPKKDLELALAKGVKVLKDRARGLGARLIQLVSTGEGLLLHAADFEVGFVTSIPATEGKAPEGITVCIDVERAASVLKSLPKDMKEVPIEVTNRDIQILSSRIPATAGDYPPMPSLNGHNQLCAALDESLADAWSYVRAAISRSGVKIAMRGAYLDFPAGRLVGTDGHRLHAAPIQKNRKTKPLLVPMSALDLVNPWEIEREGRARKQRGEPRALFLGAEGVSYARPLDDVFPNYASVIPKRPHPVCVTLNKDEVVKALRLARASVPSGCEAIVLGARREGLYLRVQDPEGKTVFETAVAGCTRGHEVNLMANPDYLHDAFSFAGWSEVELHLADDKKPMLVKGDVPGVFALVMPLSNPISDKVGVK